MSTIDEGELADRIDRARNGIVLTAVMFSVDEAEALLGAARALSAEKAARGAIERELGVEKRQHRTTIQRLTTAEAETARLRERVKEMEEALAPFVGALAAYRAVHSTRIVAGSTEADRRFSQGEIDDTAVEALFEAVAGLGVEPFFAAEAAAIRSENSNAE
jgi:hypothetical protein